MIETSTLIPYIPFIAKLIPYIPFIMTLIPVIVALILYIPFIVTLIPYIPFIVTLLVGKNGNMREIYEKFKIVGKRCKLFGGSALGRNSDCW